MEDLILFHGLLFDDKTADPAPASAPILTVPPTAPQPEPKLPAAPPEKPHTVDYGSSFTKIQTLPPKSAPASLDFTPDLPARPSQSIHPSRRQPPTGPGDLQSPTSGAPLATPVTASLNSPTTPKVPARLSLVREVSDEGSTTRADSPPAEQIVQVHEPQHREDSLDSIQSVESPDVSHYTTPPGGSPTEVEHII